MLLNETDFKAQLPVSVNISWGKISPDSRRAGLKYIKPILGKDLFSILEAAYESDTLDADQEALMDYIKPAHAHLAAWLSVPKTNITHGNQGVQSSHSGDSKPAFEWQVEDYEESLLQNGFDALDELIEYLESVADTDFPDWLDSEGCTLVRSNVINSAAVFTQYVPKLKGSRYLFVYLRSILSRVERVIIPAVTDKALYNEIKSQILTNTLSAANLELMPYVQEAVAHRAWAEAMTELNFSTDGEGVYLLNNTFAGTVKAKQFAELERVESIKHHHLQISEEQTKLLFDYLVENVDSYPLFEDGSTYDPDTTGSDGRPDNNDDWGVVSFI